MKHYDTPEEVMRQFPQLAGNKHQAREPVTPGDGSRYGRRHVKGVMNKTETEYALILEARHRAGQIQSWEFEPEKLLLTPRCSYLPDFLVIHNDGTREYIDTKVKATVNQTTIVKLKWCRDKWPKHQFTMETKLPKCAGWKRREF